MANNHNLNSSQQLAKQLLHWVAQGYNESFRNDTSTVIEKLIEPKSSIEKDTSVLDTFELWEMADSDKYEGDQKKVLDACIELCTLIKNAALKETIEDTFIKACQFFNKRLHASSIRYLRESFTQAWNKYAPMMETLLLTGRVKDESNFATEDSSSSQATEEENELLFAFDDSSEEDEQSSDSSKDLSCSDEEASLFVAQTLLPNSAFMRPRSRSEMQSETVSQPRGIAQGSCESFRTRYYNKIGVR